MGLAKRIRGLWTANFILFNIFHATRSDSPNHSHANPKIVYVSPFSSETRKQPSVSERQEDIYAVGGGYKLPDTSDYGAHPLPRLKPHDYSVANVVQDPIYSLPEISETVSIQDNYVEPGPDTYALPAQDSYASDYTSDEEHIHQVFVDHVNNHQQANVVPINNNYAEPAPETYGLPAPDTYDEPDLETYAQPVHDNYDSPLEEYVSETTEPAPVEPQAAPAPVLGLLQLLPLFVITVLAVIASTIVGALLG